MTRPATLSVFVEAIPQELRDRPQWVTWRMVQRTGGSKPTKIPHNPRTGNAASTTDSSTWAPFDVALAAYLADKGDGIGYVFSPDDPYTGIDLDKCRDIDTGKLADWAKDIVARFATYTELSPTGSGLHLIVLGKLPKNGRRKGLIEMYSEARFFTITGARLDGTPELISDCSEELLCFHQEVFGDIDAKCAEDFPASGHPTVGDDDDLIGKAQRAKNGVAFTKLWEGDSSTYSSPSEADLALCSMLCFWTNKDAGRIDRLFRRSGLMRPKWNESHYSGGKTYGQGTIEKALQGPVNYTSTNGRHTIGPEDVDQRAGPESTPGIPVLPDGVWTDWLERYRDWVLPTTDGAVEAMFACASVDLALAIGRNLGVYYGRPTYPNLFVGVVGPTGVSRKSTLQTRGQGIRQQAFVDDFVQVCKSIGSGEGLLERFCNQEIEGEGKNARVVLAPIPGQRVLLDEPEFTNLLKKARRPGTANITEILLSLFDGDDINPNTRKRPIDVVEPFLCIVTSTTPESLETALEDIDIDSGLIPRFASFWCSPRKPVAYPPPPDEEKLWHLSTDLAAIGKFAAKVGDSQQYLRLSPAARDEWETTYHDLTQATRQAPKAVGAIMTRVPSMIMKWALLYAVQAGHAVIEVDDLARGQLIGDYLMQTAELVPNHISKTLVAKVEAKILEALAKEPGKWLPVSSIHQLVSGRIKAQELRQSLGALVELGRIEQGGNPSQRGSLYRIV